MRPYTHQIGIPTPIRRHVGQAENLWQEETHFNTPLEVTDHLIYYYNYQRYHTLKILITSILLPAIFRS